MYDDTEVTEELTLTVALRVTGPREYVNWLRRKMARRTPLEIDTTAMDLDEELGLIPQFDTWADGNRWCDAPVNYPYAAYCDGVEIIATIIEQPGE
jgi:hypothetical protein